MDPAHQQTLIDAFVVTQQWMQQLIIDDAGQLVDLKSATNDRSLTTPVNA
jgi:hypothetical protein